MADMGFKQHGIIDDPNYVPGSGKSKCPGCGQDVVPGVNSAKKVWTRPGWSKPMGEGDTNTSEDLNAGEGRSTDILQCFGCDSNWGHSYPNQRESAGPQIKSSAGDDHYAHLGIDRGASPEAVKAAYKKLAFEHHPDRNQGSPEAAERFRRVNTAYNSILGKSEDLLSLKKAVENYEVLSKADPPPLPHDALKRPTAAQRAEHVENDSPWDVVTSAPAPTIDKLGLPTWLGRPVVAPEHMQELEQAAAIHEFGHKMPRQQAEMKAYNDYVRKQRVSASAHHLAGMKAANAAGDDEAARKHGLMYKLHSEALGHSAAGPAHPDVVAASATPQKVYRFKKHGGDAFAFAGERGGPHELGLAKALKSLYDGAVELMKAEDEPAGGRNQPARYVTKYTKEPKHCTHHTLLTARNAGYCQNNAQHVVWHNEKKHYYCTTHAKQFGAKIPEDKIEKSEKERGGERGGAKNKEREIYETHEAEHGEAEPKSAPEQPDLDKKEKSPEDKEKSKKLRTALASKTTCPREGCGKYKPHWANVCVDCHRQGYALGKGEIAIRDLSNGACRCEHYKFPHRRGGGKCKSH